MANEETKLTKKDMFNIIIKENCMPGSFLDTDEFNNFIFPKIHRCRKCNEEVDFSINGIKGLSYSFKISCRSCHDFLNSNTFFVVNQLSNEKRIEETKNLILSLINMWNNLNPEEEISDNNISMNEESSENISTEENKNSLNNEDPLDFESKLNFSTCNCSEDLKEVLSEIYEKIYSDYYSISLLCKNYSLKSKVMDETIDGIQNITKSLLKFLYTHPATCSAARQYGFYYQDRLLMFLKEYVHLQEVDELDDTDISTTLSERRKKIEDVMIKLKETLKENYIQISFSQFVSFESELEAINKMIKEDFDKED